jgi:hypothetical protein
MLHSIYDYPLVVLLAADSHLGLLPYTHACSRVFDITAIQSALVGSFGARIWARAPQFTVRARDAWGPHEKRNC